jgi:hypothetical protein
VDFNSRGLPFIEKVSLWLWFLFSHSNFELVIVPPPGRLVVKMSTRCKTPRGLVMLDDPDMRCRSAAD